MHRQEPSGVNGTVTVPTEEGADPQVYQVKATVTVTADTITPSRVVTEIFEVSTTAGTAPTLSSDTKVEWSDNSQTDEPIVWDDIPAERYAKAGDFTVNGNVTVAATNAETATERAAGNTVTFPVTAKVTVAPASETGNGETDNGNGETGDGETGNGNGKPATANPILATTARTVPMEILKERVKPTATLVRTVNRKVRTTIPAPTPSTATSQMQSLNQRPREPKPWPRPVQQLPNLLLQQLR